MIQNRCNLEAGPAPFVSKISIEYDKSYYFETKGAKIKNILHRCNSNKIAPGSLLLILKNFKGRNEVQLRAIFGRTNLMDKLHPKI